MPKNIAKAMQSKGQGARQRYNNARAAAHQTKKLAEKVQKEAEEKAQKEAEKAKDLMDVSIKANSVLTDLRSRGTRARTSMLAYHTEISRAEERTAGSPKRGLAELEQVQREFAAFRDEL